MNGSARSRFLFRLQKLFDFNRLPPRSKKETLPPWQLNVNVRFGCREMTGILIQNCFSKHSPFSVFSRVFEHKENTPMDNMYYITIGLYCQYFRRKQASYHSTKKYPLCSGTEQRGKRIRLCHHRTADSFLCDLFAVDLQERLHSIREIPRSGFIDCYQILLFLESFADRD